MKDNFDNVQDLKDTLLNEGRTGLTDFTVASDDDDEDLQDLAITHIAKA